MLTIASLLYLTVIVISGHFENLLIQKGDSTLERNCSGLTFYNKKLKTIELTQIGLLQQLVT